MSLCLYGFMAGPSLCNPSDFTEAKIIPKDNTFGNFYLGFFIIKVAYLNWNNLNPGQRKMKRKGKKVPFIRKVPIAFGK